MDSRELKGLMEAYSEVYAPQEVDEAVKGEPSERRADLAAERRAGHRPLPAKEGEKYASYKMAQMAYAKRKKMGEEVDRVDENRYAMRNPEEYERMQRKPKQKSERERRMNDPHMGINSPAFQQFMKQQMSGSGGKKKTNEEFDIFDIVLEFLQAEGYAETEKDALSIMVNLSEEEILEYRKLAAAAVGGLMALNMMKPGIPSPQHKTPTPERERTELPSHRSAKDSQSRLDKLKRQYDADQSKMDQSIKRDKEVRDSFYRNR